MNKSHLPFQKHKGSFVGFFSSPSHFEQFHWDNKIISLPYGLSKEEEPENLERLWNDNLFFPSPFITLFSQSFTADRFCCKQLPSQMTTYQHQGLLGSSSHSGNDCCKLKPKSWKEEAVLCKSYSLLLYPSFQNWPLAVCQFAVDLFKRQKACAFNLLSFQLRTLCD